MQIGGHHILEKDAIAGARSFHSQAPAERTGPDNRNGQQESPCVCGLTWPSYCALRACMTSSALGLEATRCSATRARSSSDNVGAKASRRRKVTETSSM